MKQVVIFVIIGLLTQRCGSVQCACNSNGSIKRLIAERFEIEKYKELEKSNKSHYLEHELEITLGEGENCYAKSSKEINSNLVYFRLYFKDSLTIYKTGCRLSNIDVGEHMEFDRQGKIVSRINYDELYTLDYKKLAKLVKDSFEVDIFDEDKVSITRVVQDGVPKYGMTIRLGAVTFRGVIINAETGEIIQNKIERSVE